MALLNRNTRNEEFADFADNKGFTYVPSYFDNAFQEDAEKCVAEDMNAHLAKPLDIEKMKKTIKSICS